jgi:type IV pilus assembly protein PilN
MIQVNLLPVREAQRLADLRDQVMQLLLVLIVVAGTIAVSHSRMWGHIEQSQQRVAQMESDIALFQPQLEQVAAFKKKKAGLEKKIDVIDGLDRARNGPVRMFDELAIHAPERLWLKSLSTKGSAVKISGESLDNELVASFLRALGESPYFGSVDLESAELATGNGQAGFKIVKFNIDAELVSPKKQVAKPKAAKPKAQG